MPSSILVVEDEPAIAELIAVNLQHAGHYPIRAYNAEQALSLMSDVLPDLVLLDWMLPGIEIDSTSSKPDHCNSNGRASRTVSNGLAARTAVICGRYSRFSGATL